MTTTDNYLEERIKGIFDIPSPRTFKRASNPLERLYFIGGPAKQGLLAKVQRKKLLSAYLTWVAEHNPTYHFWCDHRPDELRQTDAARLEQGLLPLWTYGMDQQEDTLSLVLPNHATDTYASLALAMGIGPQQYVVRNAYRPYEGIRSTPLEKLHTLSPRRLTGWFLRAFGMAYIVPTNEPTADDIKPTPTTTQKKGDAHAP